MGQPFESIYQFNKDNNVLVDLWGKAVGDVELLDEDKRSFFYFAFNCYDTERDIYFEPDDILQLDVKYNRFTYEYQGKEETENINPDSKEVEQRIEPDERKIAGGDEKRSNKKLYIYNTINRLSEADLSKDVSSTNAAVLRQAAKKYDWAVQFGAEEGYPYKNTEAGILWNHQYDINYTEIEDFNAIHIVYRYEGRRVSTGTNSLIYEETIVVSEPTDDKRNREEKKKDENNWALVKLLEDEDLSFLKKNIEIIKLYAKPVLPFVLTILVIMLIRNMCKSKLVRTIGKHLGNKIIKKIEERED